MQDSADKVIERLLVFSNNKLKNKDDLERIIKIAMESNKMNLLQDVAFRAKFLQGLFSIIQRGESPVNEEVLARYVKEYSDNIKIVKDILKEIIKGAGSFINNIFEEKYFTYSQESISNLNDFCYDLSWYKMYLNNQNLKD